MAVVEFHNVSKSFRGKKALDDVSFGVEADHFTMLCGPPQCGKSVLLRMLVGLEKPDTGSVSIDGIDLHDIAAGRRRIGYVPQSFALYPHFSVFNNIAYPLRLHGVSRAEIQRRVGEAAELLGITHLLNNKPDQISGGEKQRTAVARGLLNDAEIFVLDDPLVGLDFKLRERLMDDLRQMRTTLDATFIYATSDSLEALMLADDLIVLDAGRVVESNATAAVYNEPRRLRSAELIGFPRCNTLEGDYEARRSDPDDTGHGVFSSDLLTFETDLTESLGRLIAVLRPEDIRINPGDGDARALRGRGTIRLVEDLGAEYVVYFLAGEHWLTTCVAAIDCPQLPAEGATIEYSVYPDDVLLYRADGGAFAGRGRSRVHA